ITRDGWPLADARVLRAEPERAERDDGARRPLALRVGSLEIDEPDLLLLDVEHDVLRREVLDHHPSPWMARTPATMPLTIARVSAQYRFISSALGSVMRRMEKLSNARYDERCVPFTASMARKVCSQSWKSSMGRGATPLCARIWRTLCSFFRK